MDIDRLSDLELWYEICSFSSPDDIMGMSSRATIASLHRSYLAFFDELLRGRKVERWLDLGCSNMALTAKLAPYAGHIVGVDSSATGLRVAKEKYPDIASVCRRLPDLSGIEGPFDIVSAFGTLYYLTQDDRARCLEAMKPLLRPGSLLVVDHEGASFDTLCQAVGFVRERTDIFKSPAWTFDFLFWQVENRARRIQAMVELANDEESAARLIEGPWGGRLSRSVAGRPFLWRGFLTFLSPVRGICSMLYGSQTLLRGLGLFGTKTEMITAWRWRGEPTAAP